jgi:hypothetical protein
MSKFENTKTGIVVSVDDSKDERFTDGWKKVGSKPAGVLPDGVPDVSWKADDLKSYAASNGVDLGGATKKEDIVAAIAAASTPPSE